MNMHSLSYVLNFVCIHCIYLLRGSGGLKSCSRLLDRAESGELTELIILPPPLKQFTEQDAKRLSQILRKKSCRVTTLIIPHSLSPESTQLIGSSLPSSSVTYLDLGNHTFGDDGAIALAHGIAGESDTSVSLDLETLLLNKKGMYVIHKHKFLYFVFHQYVTYQSISHTIPYICEIIDLS